MKSRKIVVLHGFVAFLYELNLILAHTKRDVVGLVDPALGRWKQTLAGEVLPVLAAAQELLAHMLDFILGCHSKKTWRTCGLLRHTLVEVCSHMLASNP